MKFSSFRRKHRIAKADFDQLLELGLPTTSTDELDEDTVVQWLDAKSSRGQLIGTKVEASNVLGVSTTTLRNWELKHAHMPSFPCFEEDLRAFVDSIRAKPELKVVDPNARPAPEDRYRTAKAELAEMQVAEHAGGLLDREETVNAIRRCVARVKAIARAFPDRLAKRFKERGHSREDVEFVRTEALDMIAAMFNQMSRDLLEEDTEEDMAIDDEFEEA